MDNEMIERAAKAAKTYSESVISIEEFDYRDLAKAIIKTMREPTEKMLEAAFKDYAYREKNKEPWNGRTMFNAMIDTVINE